MAKSGMSELHDINLALIGGGQMAEALIAGWLGSRRLEARQIAVTDPVLARRDVMKRRFGVAASEDNGAAAAAADIIMLAVKPQQLDAAMTTIGSQTAGKLVVSIVAGVTIDRLTQRLSGSARVIRVMPNTPALVGEGMSVFSPGSSANQVDLARVRLLFEAVGRVATVDEALLDAVTGLSGSGPAYVFAAIEALADGGVKMGLPRPIADLLAAQTVLGAARMQLETGEHPARLKDRVASPGGTTIAGLHALEQGGFRAALIAAVEAATVRARQLVG